MRVLGKSYILFALTLAGCVGMADPPQPLPEDPHPFTYQRADYPFTVHFAAAAAQPSADEVRRLQAFLEASSARPGDTVAIGADTTALGAARRATLSDILARAGLVPVAGVAVAAEPETVRLMLEETVAVAPHCGDWPVFAGDQPSNAPALFLGCALRNNLYQMVVDKRDLAVGQTPGPADAEPGMRAVQAYREGPPAAANGAPPAADNSAADNATAAATAAAAMANPAGGASGNGP